MFTWAVIDYSYSVLSIQKAAMDVPASRPFEWWVIIPDGTKVKNNAVYNPATGEIE